MAKVFLYALSLAYSATLDLDQWPVIEWQEEKTMQKAWFIRANTPAHYKRLSVRNTPSRGYW